MGCSGSKDRPRQFQPIPDRFQTIEEVQKAVRAAGLESSNLIIGVDFTKSNTWTGEKTFGGMDIPLHLIHASVHRGDHTLEPGTATVPIHFYGVY